MIIVHTEADLGKHERKTKFLRCGCAPDVVVGGGSGKAYQRADGLPWAHELYRSDGDGVITVILAGPQLMVPEAFHAPDTRRSR